MNTWESFLKVRTLFSLLSLCPTLLVVLIWRHNLRIFEKCLDCGGPGSSVGIATGYGLDGPGIESRWGRDFPYLSRLALGPTSLLYNGYRVFTGGKKRQGRDADLSLLLVLWSRKSRAISLLPLWAVRPVQSLSACTRVTFTFFFSGLLLYKLGCLCIPTLNSTFNKLRGI